MKIRRFDNAVLVGRESCLDYLIILANEVSRPQLN